MSEQQTSDIKAQPAIVEMTIQVTRAKTGKVDEYKLIGTALPEAKDQPKEPE